MLKLPVCPHCGAVYSYKEVRQMKSGTKLCYHCNKKFSIHKKKNAWVFMTVVCIILIIINTAIMISSENFIPVLFVLADMLVITAAFLLLPLTVRFRPEKFSKAEKRERKKVS